MDKPQILTLNLKPEVVNKIKEKGYNLYEGSLGKKINISGSNRNKYCLPNHNFPDNIHEYDIIMIDLDYVKTIAYDSNYNKSQNDIYLCSDDSNLIFDPRYYTLNELKNELAELVKHEAIILIFQSENSRINYKFIKYSGGYRSIKNEQTLDIYSFLQEEPPFNKNKSGKETSVAIPEKELGDFFNKYNNDFHYKIVFDNKSSDENFIPLIVNKDDEIISYLNVIENAWLFMLPQLNDYSEFIIDFLENIAPEYFPKLFPNSTKNLWLNQSQYFVPNQELLLAKQDKLRKEWEEENDKIEEEITVNYGKYKFLHDILTSHDEELVLAIITYLEWLGFKNVKNMDNEKEKGEVNEEDIQIENEEGLLVIEVKGLGGTSKDSDCNQVLKIKYRRAKDRNKFDVYGLYIVNNQKHLPPHKRQNPPFTQHQINDAENEERGLLTTYQLFNLYFDIEKGIMTKEEARNRFYNYGLINFIPSELIYIDTVEEIFKDGFVSILTLNNIRLEIGENIFIEKNSRFDIAEILNIQVDNKSVKSISNGEIGIETNMPIKKKSKIYIKEK